MIKNKNETNNSSSTSTLPITGQTTLNLDNVKVEESVTLATSYEDVTMPSRYVDMYDYLTAPNGLLIKVVYDTESSDTYGNDYYLYDVYNKKLISDISFAYYDYIIFF